MADRHFNRASPSIGGSGVRVNCRISPPLAVSAAAAPVRLRFVASRPRSQRRRLDVSVIDFGKPPGASTQSICQHFAFNRLREAGADRRAKYERSAVWLVPVDGGLAKARGILGPGTRSLTVRPGEIPTALFTSDGRWLIGFLEDGVRRESRVAVAPAASLAEPEPAWSLRIDTSDKIVDFAYAQGTLYAATYQDAPRYK